MDWRMIPMIFRHELRRQWRPWWWIVVPICLTVSTVCAVVGYRDVLMHQGQPGGTLLQTLLLTWPDAIFRVLLYVLAAGLAAGSIVVERERGWLDDLCLAGVSPVALVLGKAGATLVSVGAWLLCSLPIAVAWHVTERLQYPGNFEALAIVRTYELVLTYLVLGLCISAWCPRRGSAYAWTYGVMVGVPALAMHLFTLPAWLRPGPQLIPCVLYEIFTEIPSTLGDPLRIFLAPTSGMCCISPDYYACERTALTAYLFITLGLFGLAVLGVRWEQWVPRLRNRRRNSSS